jgi:hypothetical protein
MKLIQIASPEVAPDTVLIPNVNVSDTPAKDVPN